MTELYKLTEFLPQELANCKSAPRNGELLLIEVHSSPRKENHYVALSVNGYHHSSFWSKPEKLEKFVTGHAVDFYEKGFDVNVTIEL